MAGNSGHLPDALERFLKRYAVDATRQNARKALQSLRQKGARFGKGFEPALMAYHLETVCRFHDARHRRVDWEPLRYGHEPKERFTAQDLKRIVARAKKLREDVRNLKKTSAVLDLAATGVIPQGDLLSGIFPDEKVVAFYGLINLPSLAAQLKNFPRARILMGVELHLWILCRYVKRTTGRWNDTAIIEILRPFGIPHTESEYALRMWRSRLLDQHNRHATEN